MSQAAPRFTAENSAREFWKPQRPAMFQVETCEACKNELVIGARFCHLCGRERVTAVESTASPIAQLLDWKVLRGQIGFSSASLIFAIAGFCCVLAALLTGMLFSATTPAEWQAIQEWRVEWLLGALVGFSAANLFKKS